MGDYVSGGDNHHIVPRKGEGILAGPEEKENRAHEYHRDNRKQKSDDSIEGYLV